MISKTINNAKGRYAAPSAEEVTLVSASVLMESPAAGESFSVKDHTSLTWDDEDW